MKSFNLILTAILCCTCFLGTRAQEYSYKHYDRKDGLIGNHIYHAVQDKDGFLWLATETGVSRFDGTSFKNFTTNEGLPDNEVLKLFVDSKGRVWMLPFKNSICYYYNGKIHNAKNDSIVKQIKVSGYIEHILEDKAGNIFFSESINVIVLTKDNKIFSNGSVFTLTNVVIGIGTDDQKNVILRTGKNFFKIKLNAASLDFEEEELGIRFWGYKSAFFYLRSNLIIYLNNYVNMLDKSSLVLYKYLENKQDTIKVPADYNLISFLNDSILFFNTKKGSLKYNINNKSYLTTYLPDENVTYTFEDNDQNLWFTTSDRGLFRLYTETERNVFFTDGSKKNKPIKSITGTAANIIAGSDNDAIYTYDKSTGDIKLFHLAPTISNGDVMKIMKFKDKVYFLTEGSLHQADTLFKQIDLVRESEVFSSYKDFDFNKDGKLFFSSHLQVYSLMKNNKNASTKKANGHSSIIAELNERMLASVDDYYIGRTTALCYTDSGIYIGTLTGLKFVDWHKKIFETGTHFPGLNGHITRLLNFNGKLWVGTNDQGVFCFDGKKIVKQISLKDNLSSNLITALYADSNHLWVGTDQGLNRIGLADTLYPLLQGYTTSDGISSDMINAIYLQNDTVYVGTPEGLSFFDWRLLKRRSRCALKILDITISGKTIPFDSTKLFLKHRDANIRFDFVAISFRSEGEIIYHYKLLGIDTDWKTTEENFLQYPTLPSGDYELQLYAVNKFGIKSKTVTISFEIEKTLFEKEWFIVLFILFTIVVAFILANWRIRKVKKMQMEKTANAAKIAQLEQQALKSQMNPHFIFNCLNSIQQYVIDKDIQGANKFISGFSKLIRQTLDNSGKEEITVAEEESFLRSYLQLEKSRFEDKFDYNIFIDPQIPKDEYALPPMLLQPYIENCIRHGIMHKSNGKGFIDVRFNLSGEKLSCTVIDNGIGRSAASNYKNNQEINYQSKGTDITWQRIKMINMNKDSDIVLRTEDLKDSGGEGCGTKVTIVIPVGTKNKE
ncbi:MAG: histidine kinase [Ferruginibacter sp.]